MQFGLPNWIVGNLKSDSNNFEQQNQSDSKSDDQIGLKSDFDWIRPILTRFWTFSIQFDIFLIKILLFLLKSD